MRPATGAALAAVLPFADCGQGTGDTQKPNHCQYPEHHVCHHRWTPSDRRAVTPLRCRTMTKSRSELTVALSMTCQNMERGISRHFPILCQIFATLVCSRFTFLPHIGCVAFARGLLSPKRKRAATSSARLSVFFSIESGCYNFSMWIDPPPDRKLISPPPPFNLP